LSTQRRYWIILLLWIAAFSAVHAQKQIAIKNLLVRPIASSDTIVAPLLPQVVAANRALKDSLKQAQTSEPSFKVASTLDAPIVYSATDSVAIDQKLSAIILSNQAKITYADTQLASGIISIDYVTNEVQAGRIKNSEGNLDQTPNFKQGPSVVVPDSIRYNFNTEKAIIFNSRTEQGAGYGSMGPSSENMKVYTEMNKK
jgi:hypothetical protein